LNIISADADQRVNVIFEPIIVVTVAVTVAVAVAVAVAVTVIAIRLLDGISSHN